MNSILLFLITTLSGSLNDADTSKTKFGIFRVQPDGVTVVMDGEIRRRTLPDFEKMIAQYPDLKVIQMRKVPGSLDDEVALDLSLKVHQRGIQTHILDHGEIASGGVDFFLAGVKRSKGINTRIGVHAWDNNTGIGKRTSATDYPVGHAEHQFYIDYYISIGMPPEEAAAFYYFTIHAAPADGIHWLTEAEIIEYKVLTN